MKRTPAVLLTLTLGIAIGSLLLPSRDNPAIGNDQLPDRPPQGWFTDDASQFVFFAVLEGLYADGVSQEVVDIVVPLKTPPATADNPAPQPYRDHFVSFIYTCPLCHPAAEAFLLYAGRKPFFGQKGSAFDTFGPGIPAEILKKLRSEQKFTRLEGLRDLIDRWVKRRLDLMRLTDKERAAWEQRIGALRGEGNKALAQFQRGGNGDFFGRMYADWKSCPTCEGSFGACKLKQAHE